MERNKRKRKIIWNNPVYIVRSLLYETWIGGIYTTRIAAEKYVSVDPENLYIEESGLDNDFIIIDEES